MRIAWKNSADEISADDWGRCLPPHVEGRWWYQTLERSGLDDQFRFAYAVVESDDAMICIAPTFLMDVPIDLVAPPWIARLLRMGGTIARRLRYQRTLFVGSPCADEGTLGVSPEASARELVPLVHDACMSRAREMGASIVVWKDFPREFERNLDELAKQRGIFRVVSYPGTRVALPEQGGFDAYLAALSSSHRHNLRKKLRKGAAAGALIGAAIQQPEPAMLEEIFSLFWQTYEHGTTKFERLNRDFFNEISKFEKSHFLILQHPANKKLAAFMLCFQVGKRVINKFIGLDYTLGDEWFLYFRLWEAAVRWATSIGATEIQSGQTGYRAKLDVGHSLVPLTNYCRHRNPILNRLFALASRGVGWSDLDADLGVYLAAHPEADQSKALAARTLIA